MPLLFSAGALLGLLIPAAGAFAATTRFASPNGTSTPSNCTHIASPCSLMTALGSALADDNLSLAAGTYDVSGVPLAPVPLHWVSTDPEARPVLTSAAAAPTLTLTPAQSGSSFEGVEIDNTNATGAVLEPALLLQAGVAATVDGSVVKGRSCIEAPDSAALTVDSSAISSTIIGSCLRVGAVSTVRGSTVSEPSVGEAPASPPPVMSTSGLVEDSTVSGGLELDGPAAVARRVRAVGATAISGQGLVVDSLATSSAPDGAAIVATAPQGGTLTVVNTTAVNSRGPALLAPPVFSNMPVVPNHLEVTNSIARGGTVDVQVTDRFACALGSFCSAGQMSIDHSDFTRRAPLATAADARLITEGAGNVAADPRFVNPAVGDFHLASGSQAIDAGVADDLALPADLDGHQRVQGAAPDLGAFETSPPVSPPPSSPPPSSPPPRAHSRPALSHLKIHPAAIQVRNARSKPSRRRSAKITFSLSQAATVRLSFARCRHARGRPNGCTHLVTVGAFTVDGRHGGNVVLFSGRLAHGRVLAPGIYKVTAAPIIGGKDSGTAQAARVTILPERRNGGR
jgi:hypothetical protein